MITIINCASVAPIASRKIYRGLPIIGRWAFLIDPSGNAPLSLARVLACYDLLQKQPKNDKLCVPLDPIV